MYKIILSLTAHESVECLHDLIDNIKKCFVHYEIIILLSLTESLGNVFDNKYDFVKIVTIRPDNFQIWGTIHLFHQHILNVKYLYENNIKYDFFWFVASNEMFIKIVSENFIDEHCLKIINKKDRINDTDYDIYYNDLLINKSKWRWIKFIKKDKYFMNYIHKNKFKIFERPHEGLVISSDLMLEIYNEYNENKFYDQATFKDYVMEEIFITTYIMNKYITNQDNIKTFCFMYLYTRGINNYKQIEKNLSEYHLSIKPVKRDYNDPMRIMIRNKIL